MYFSVIDGIVGYPIFGRSVFAYGKHNADVVIAIDAVLYSVIATDAVLYSVIATSAVTFLCKNIC